MTAITAAGAEPAPINRTMILASVMLATILTALDSTIANVALPHIAGSVSASQDQIAWVLTSYIVSAAIFTPLTSFLTGRFGRKRLFVIAVAGFIAASALCGAAQNLPEIVGFRVLQGVFGAPLIPLSQALILDIYTLAERGPAMAIWGVGVMVAPIVGPVLGGWLTESWSWRWVFYINLPLGILCLLGIMTFIHETAKDRERPFDLFGFATLSVAITAFQLMLDRGQSQGWFESSEIVLDAAIAFIAFWFTFVHTLTSKRAFLPIDLFKDRNFTTASVLGIMVGVILLSVTALLPLLMQSVYGFSVLQTGILSSPRGFGSIISMLAVGRLIGRVDTRALLFSGLTIFAISFFWMSDFTVDTSAEVIAAAGFVQGLGTGFVFMPMTTMAFGTMPPSLRGDGTSFYTLMRNLGGSAGISLMLAMLTNFSAGSRTALIAPYGVDNSLMPALPPALNIGSDNGVIALSSAVDHQAAMLGYTQVFHLMFLVTLVMMPLILLMRMPKEAPVAGRGSAPAVVEH